MPSIKCRRGFAIPDLLFRGFVIPTPLNRSLALEGKQLVSVVLVLLAACRDFGRETRLERSGQRLEAVEDGDDAVLLGKWRDRDSVKVLLI